jgi:ectoine hydroxylase-related dioxygenase (phytanoyl-CoA dioxygenase family)
MSSSEMQRSFADAGYVVVRGVLPRSGVLRARAHAEALIAGTDEASRRYVQTAFDANGAVKLVKASGLAEHDTLFNELATEKTLVDVVETLLGVGSRRFRDVMVVKPARTGGAFSYHQDSAFWDVEPKALVSAWVGLGDVTREGSCLSVIPGTHRREIDHTICLRGRYQLPKPLTRTLRRMVSLAGTGDNPEGAGGNFVAWKAKRWLLAETTKYAPVLFDLQDFRIPPDQVKKEQEVLLPVQAGDVIFFHSLLWHASGPNQSETTRIAEIISFMGPTARFVGRGAGTFPLARRA